MTITPKVRPIAALRRQVIRPRVGLALVGLVILAFVGMAIYRSYQTVEAEQVTAAKDTQLQSLADPLAALCANDAVVRARLGDTVCFTAQQVVAMPPTTPPAGAPGEPGKAGRGIVATVIRADGHLVVTYSDGAVIDAGGVVGKAGESGTPGRGITGSSIDAGSLVLTFTDGTTENLGPVTGAKGAEGPAGRGITSTQITEGRLIVTFTDGTTEDAGAVPAGPAGANGSPAAQITINRTNGTTVVCPRTGGEDTAPVYTCENR